MKKISESYFGTPSSTEYNSVADGSETLQNGINTNNLGNGDGQGSVYDANHANHPTTPLGEQGHEKNDSDTGFPPFSVQMVDDNHSGIEPTSSKGSGLLGIILRGKKADESNFFLQNSTSGGVADSPQTGTGGHAREELVPSNGVENVSNNTPHPTNEANEALIHDKGLVDKKQIKEDKDGTVTPDINKGRNLSFAHLTSRPFFSTSMGIMLKKSDDIGNMDPEEAYREESNVKDIMYPFEEDVKHKKVHHDFGTGDQIKDNRTKKDAPLEGNQETEEAKNYSGIENSIAGLLGIMLRKKADYGAIVPSSNPNSGADNEMVNKQYMTDGKNAVESSNEDDKWFDDPAKYRQKLKYHKTEDSQNYNNFSGSGSGGMGMEGDGVFSGIENSGD